MTGPVVKVPTKKRNSSSSFEGFYKVENNEVFHFEILLFSLEIFTHLYYANEESDEVINIFT